MAATVLVLLGGAIMAVGTVVAARVCLRALLRRAQRRMWDDLVARHRELDRELDRIWQRWRARPLAGDQAAVGDEDLAGDVAGGVGG